MATVGVSDQTDLFVFTYSPMLRLDAPNLRLATDVFWTEYLRDEERQIGLGLGLRREYGDLGVGVAVDVKQVLTWTVFRSRLDQSLSRSLAFATYPPGITVMLTQRVDPYVRLGLLAGTNYGVFALVEVDVLE